MCLCQKINSAVTVESDVLLSLAQAYLVEERPRTRLDFWLMCRAVQHSGKTFMNVTGAIQ